MPDAPKRKGPLGAGAATADPALDPERLAAAPRASRSSFTRWLGRRSIATRLFLSAAVWSAAILLAAGFILSAINRHASEEDFDGRLGVYLRALVAELAAPGDGPRTELGALGEPLFELPLSGWYWQVSRLDTAEPDIRGSTSLFTERLPKLDGPGEAGAGKAYVMGPDDRRLRMVQRLIDAGDQGRYLVQVAAAPDDMERAITRFKAALGLTFSALAVALVASTALQVRFGLRPLRRLQDGVAAIRRGEGERIAGSFPRDIAPLASELNLLIAANREIVERARTHAGNLAHALKTPLSVITNETDVAALHPDTAALAAKVREQTGIMRNQVDHHLGRARAAARSSVIGTLTEAKPVIDGLVRTFEKIYRDRVLRFDVAVVPAARFRGESQDLEEMVGNLVDNAGKWGQAIVAIRVGPASERDAAGLAVVVEDDGPGMTTDECRLAMRRGRRLDESKPGSGLGLSIVADLAGVYGGSLSLDRSPLGGLRATLLLP
ncbi:sensor histidine kinase [Lichenihabitans sp. Uapishka_5]|uniref:sensor histidine kinase n=1 Tax=Lichenihabitans sp. Uapishka_5 TaxID=3037302 RepID=UPI0029E7DA63|nr:HAMP domain-containing sensor histidine kinase [Lichenihabitans sp. Uapishka_5]